MVPFFKATIKQHLRNIPGWRTNRKIVVFESDDWGAIRMPSKEVYLRLLQKELQVDQNTFNRNDALESNEDLEALFEVLSKYKSIHGKHPVFTALTVVANPSFDKIKDNNFTKYEYEPVTETLSNYGATHNRVFQLYKEGIDRGIFYPEFHGREHLNVKRWMGALQNKKSISRLCFDHHFYGLGPKESNEKRENHFPAFDLDNQDDLNDQKKILKEGLALFHTLFDYKAKFFVPPNFLCHHGLEEFVSSLGIKYLTGSRNHIEPIGNHEYKRSIRYTGKRNKLGQLYIVRNSQFEYAQTGDVNAWKKTLKDIETAFFWKKPAIISTHRLNYIGFINEKNREEGLDQLDQLLKNILKKWPDTEFMSTSQLGDLMLNHEK